MPTGIITKNTRAALIMKLIQSLQQKQSMHLGFELCRAIEMLALDIVSLERLIDEELMENPCLFEHYPRPASSLFARALATKSSRPDFRMLMMQQVGEERFNSVEKSIAEHLIYNLNDDGLLPNLKELSEELADALQVFPEWIESVRRRLMALEPLGVGAKNIEEALLVQLRLMKPDAAWSHNWLLDLCKEKKEHAVLRMLNPRPAQALLSDHALLLTPELLLIKNHSGYGIEFVYRTSDRLAVKRSFATRGYENRAHFFLKALHFRESSLQHVAKCIVEHQRGWFFNSASLRPLTLREVALATALNESSVSRLVQNKCISTDRGTFELKFFFSGKLSGIHGQDRAAAGIKDLVALLIRHDKGTLSDQAISLMLKDQGVKISRRTVNKYRSELGFLNAFQRRALK